SFRVGLDRARKLSSAQQREGSMDHLSIYRLKMDLEPETYTAENIKPLLDCGKLQEIFSAGWRRDERLIGIYSTVRVDGSFILRETGLITPAFVGMRTRGSGNWLLDTEKLGPMAPNWLKT